MSTSNSAGLLSVINSQIILSRSQTDKINIFDLVVEFNFYQDLFSPFISGSLVVIDALGLISEAQFDGSETISISVKNLYDPKGRTYDLSFRVFKVSNRDIENYKKNSYVLHLISLEAIVNGNISLSRKLSGKPEEIIQRMLTNDIKTTKKFEFETTKYPVDFIPAKWNPFYCASWLASKSVSAKYSNASYFFYEDFDGYKFKSLQYGIDEIPQMIYRVRAPNMSSSSSESNLIYNLSTVIDFQVKESTNILDGISYGLFNSVLYIKDLIRNEYTRQDFKYQEDFTSSKRLNPTLPFKTIFKGEAVTKVGYKHSNEFPNREDSDSLSSWAQKRISFNEQLGITNVQVTVPGLFALQVGQMIRLEVPKVIKDNNGNVLDKQLSGNYIVSAVRHVSPDKNQHYMGLDLIKDSNI